jgi:hypothetical protein
MIMQPQWAHLGASAWMAHSKLSNTCFSFPTSTSNDLSYSFPQTSHLAIFLPFSARNQPDEGRGLRKWINDWGISLLPAAQLSDGERIIQARIHI